MDYHFLLQGNLPNPGIKTASPAVAADSFTTELPTYFIYELPVYLIYMIIITKHKYFYYTSVFKIILLQSLS